jgi:uncharacterized protein with PIN domain
MKYIKKKFKEMGNQCSLCAAKFEVWLNNSGVDEERREKISQHMLSYCPVCGKVDEK